MLGRCFVAGLAIAVFIGVSSLGAQGQRPLTPLPTEGRRVAPFFDGWYANPDGSTTFSFGYSNPNKDEVVEIPLGPDNVVEPKEFDGRQPTSFPPVPAEPPDGAAPRTDRRERSRGVFTVTVPAGFKGDVVWTLRNRGQAFSVPGRSRAGAYQLRWPMAMGSVPPLLRFKPDGPSGRGPSGIYSEAVNASVGAPLSLAVFVTDDSKRDVDPTPVRERGPARPPMTVAWFKHAGPGPVAFSPDKVAIPQLEGTAATSATFKQPGEYVIRGRVDNFGRVDTSAGNQCCWTNGYVKVTVK